MKSKGWKKYCWLNLCELSNSLLLPGQILAKCKYFTSRTKSSAGAMKRQNTYLEALATVPEIEVIYGNYMIDPFSCDGCGREIIKSNEKQTDVNIAVEILVDAVYNNYDTAILITGDSDLTAAILAVRKLFTSKKILVCFPPERVSLDLQKTTKTFHLGQANLRNSQFPDTVVSKGGFNLMRPQKWT